MNENDLRVEMRLRNAALYNAIFPRWDSVAAFCREAGVRGTELGKLLNLKLTARCNPRPGPSGSPARGEYRATAERIATFLGMLPEDLFPDELYDRFGGKTTTAFVETSSVNALPMGDRVFSLMAPSDETAETRATDLELKDRIDSILETLTFREREVIKLRFGIPDGVTHTLEEIGDLLGISKERVRLIESRAVWRLRKPMRSRQLEGFLDSFVDDPPSRRPRELVPA